MGVEVVQGSLATLTRLSLAVLSATQAMQLYILYHHIFSPFCHFSKVASPFIPEQNAIYKCLLK